MTCLLAIAAIRYLSLPNPNETTEIGFIIRSRPNKTFKHRKLIRFDMIFAIKTFISLPPALSLPSIFCSDFKMCFALGAFYTHINVVLIEIAVMAQVFASNSLSERPHVFG